MGEREGFEPPIPFQVCRFSSTQVGSDPFRKFSTLLDFSTAYKPNELHHDDPFRSVLIIELLQFYYSVSEPLSVPLQSANGMVSVIAWFRQLTSGLSFDLSGRSLLERGADHVRAVIGWTSADGIGRG